MKGQRYRMPPIFQPPAQEKTAQHDYRPVWNDKWFSENAPRMGVNVTSLPALAEEIPAQAIRH
jgi:hypothetical protein